MTERPEKANAAQLARWGGAAAKISKETNDPEFNPSKARLQGRLRSWEDVSLLTDRLLLVADEKEFLLRRVRWAQLRLELGMVVDDIDDLVEKADVFKLVCRALSAPSDGRRAP